MGNDMFGAAGKDITLRFPVGTIIADQETGEVLHELLTPGEKIVLARGGEAVLATCASRVRSTVHLARKHRASLVSASA